MSSLKPDRREGPRAAASTKNGDNGRARIISDRSDPPVHLPAVVYVARPGTTRRFDYVSPHLEALTGWSVEQWMSDPWKWLHSIHPEDRRGRLEAERTAHKTGNLLAEYRIIDRDGRALWMREEATVTFDENRRATTISGVIFDISDRKALESQLRHRTFHDPLSGLANRELFINRLEHALERSIRSGDDVGVLVIDIDDFKLVNESFGHQVGDELLMAIAERLKMCLRSSDTAARLGGDEFAVLVEGPGGLGGALLAAERIGDTFLTPIDLADRQIGLAASIGVAVGSQGDDPYDLLRNAEVAMHRAKQRDKGTYEIFDPSMHSDAIERLELSSDLHRALDNDEFSLAYQPIVSIGDGSVIGFEALLRWHHPKRGTVSPATFIPLAESADIIVVLGEWVLEQSVRQIKQWRSMYPGAQHCYMSVNVSTRQLERPGLSRFVAKLLEDCAVEASGLVLEITENLFVRETTTALKNLREMRDLGVRIALDDFGTGYSSLGYLQRFSLDLLKIDRSFISMLDSEDRSDLAKAIVKLGDALDLTVVAEGIETQHQLNELKSLHCAMGQGYLFSAPRSAVEMNQLILSQGLTFGTGSFEDFGVSSSGGR